MISLSVPCNAKRILRVLDILLILVVIVPFLISGTAAWRLWDEKKHLAIEQARLNASAVQAHTLSVLDGQLQSLHWLRWVSADLSWAEIRQSKNLHNMMQTAANTAPEVDTLWMISPDGQGANSSLFFMPQVNVTDRDYYKAMSQGNDEVYLGQTVIGKLSGQTGFHMALRRQTKDFKFDGLMLAHVDASYYDRMWQLLKMKSDDVIVLLRDDGTVLIRSDLPQKLPLPLQDPLIFSDIVARGRDAGLLEKAPFIDGTPRLVAFHKLGSWPAYVLYGLDQSALTADWCKTALVYGGWALFCALTMAGLTLYTRYRVRCEHTAAKGWQQTALQLKEEIAHRDHIEEERRRTEEMLLQAQKMEALGQMTGGIAHDFNNLLTAIGGNLELLKPSVTTDKARQKLDRAILAVDRAATLTGHLLTFSRKRCLQGQQVDLNTLIRSLADMLPRTLGPSIHIKLDLAPTLPIVFLDPAQIELALLNLCLNARDAMPDGGTLTLRTKQEPANSITLQVADTGTGMTPDVATHVFEPFFTTKKDGHGTGLGLSMAYGAVTQSGGTISFETKPQEGTCFSLIFPIAPPHAQKMIDNAPPFYPMGTDTGAQRWSVMVVDDDGLVLNVVTDILEKGGFAVVKIGSGSDALAALTSGRIPLPDIILMDLVMPDTNGARTGEQIHSLFPDLPIVYMTGYAEYDQMGIDLSFSHVIKKPFQPDVLVGTLVSLLRHEKF